MSLLEHYEKRLSSATDLFNEGFTSNGGKKKALELVRNAFDSMRSILMNSILNDRVVAGSEEEEGRLSDLYWLVPIDLHNWKEKHNELFKNYPEQRDKINELAQLRVAIKEAEIVPIEKDPDKVKIEKVRSSIINELEKRKAQFVEGLGMAKHFNGLHVSVNAHYVTNDKGTTFLRHFFYLNHKLTSLNMIMAIAQQYEKDKKSPSICEPSP